MDRRTTHTVKGKLTLHGVSKIVTFPATIALSGKEVSGKAEFSINRKDFGIAYAGKADDLIRDGVVLKIDVKAAAQ
jgi:polyisoprenoid-binding protein YceI